MSLGADRAQQPVPPQFPGPGSEQRVDLGHRPVRARDLAARPIKGRYWAARHLPRLQQHADQPRGTTAASAATRPSCTSTMRITAPRATAPPTPTTSRARSTTTAGARRWPGATRSIRRPPIVAPRAPTAMAASSARGGRFPRDPGHDVGPRPPLLLHRRECLQRQSHDDQHYSGPDRGNEVLTRRRQSAAAERQAAGLRQHRLRRQPHRRRPDLRSRRATLLRHLRHRRASSAT